MNQFEIPGWNPPVEKPVKTPKLIEFPAEWKAQLIQDGALTPGIVESTERAESSDRFGVGNEITVKRNGKNGEPDYFEAGWNIVANDGDVVQAQKIVGDEIYSKRIRLETVKQLNAEHNEMPIDRATAEKIGKEAVTLAGKDLIEGEYSSIEAIQHSEAAPAAPEKKSRYEALKEWLPPITGNGSSHEAKYYKENVTVANREASLALLQNAVKYDDTLASILDAAGLESTDIAAVDAVREDPEVRFKFAERFAEKLDILAADTYNDFGSRIIDNSPNNLKSDPKLYRGAMPSRVYAVNMALKMIDGEFNARHEEDDFLRGPDGKVARGQHRHAARAVLYGRVK